MISKLFAVFAVAFALLIGAPSALAQSADLSGQWRGVYSNNGQNVPFDLTLQQVGEQIMGTTTEPNTFGTSDAAFLLGGFHGDFRNGQVSFTKTYDGTGGQTHSVTYTGRMMSNGRRIVGTWRLVGGANGTFEMVR